MRNLLYILIALLILPFSLVSCNDEVSTWDKYEDWRNMNLEYFSRKAKEKNSDGELVYEKVTPNWDQGSYILMKRLKKGTGTVKPLFTSYVDLVYKGRLCDGTVFDSTYTYTDSISTLKLSSTVLGFSIALTNMVEGDSCEIIIPAYLAYVDSEKGVIKPYSNLIFGVKLKKIAAYEKPYQEP